MPYKIRHTKAGGYEVVKVATGEVVAHSKTKRNAIGFIYHAKAGEPKQERKKKK